MNPKLFIEILELLLANAIYSNSIKSGTSNVICCTNNIETANKIKEYLDFLRVDYYWPKDVVKLSAWNMHLHSKHVFKLVSNHTGKISPYMVKALKAMEEHGKNLYHVRKSYEKIYSDQYFCIDFILDECDYSLSLGELHRYQNIVAKPKEEHADTPPYGIAIVCGVLAKKVSNIFLH